MISPGVFKQWFRVTELWEKGWLLVSLTSFVKLFQLPVFVEHFQSIAKLTSTKVFSLESIQNGIDSYPKVK